MHSLFQLLYLIFFGTGGLIPPCAYSFFSLTHAVQSKYVNKHKSFLLPTGNQCAPPHVAVCANSTSASSITPNPSLFHIIFMFLLRAAAIRIGCIKNKLVSLVFGDETFIVEVFGNLHQRTHVLTVILPITVAGNKIRNGASIRVHSLAGLRVRAHIDVVVHSVPVRVCAMQRA